MKQVFGWGLFIVSSAGLTAYHLISPLFASSQSASPSSAPSPAIVSPQILSPNAYKVPYLGYDGIFYLNADSKESMNDPRNPKRILIEKMGKFTFYKDAAGKTPIARDCRYVYLGAVPDSKYVCRV